MAVLYRSDTSYLNYVGNGEKRFIAESVSFTSVLGDQNSFRAVPVGRAWEIYTLRARNGEAATKEIVFQLVDPDGLQYAVISPTGTHMSVGTLGQCGWDGRLIIPALWTLRAYFFNMAGGSTCNWQYTGVEWMPNDPSTS